jgi:hypothetical protein
MGSHTFYMSQMDNRQLSMLPNMVFVGFSVALIVGLPFISLAHGQLNECTIFEGKILVVLRANNDCLGYADAKMATNGWSIILINNQSIYMEKHDNGSQLSK